MTIVTFIREHGNGAICVGTLPDGAYDEETCILVSPRPTPAHKWDNDSEEWVISIEDQRDWIRPIRDIELTRTDKFILPDFYAEFTEGEQTQITNYRQALREVPDHETVAEIVMPDCPEFMQ